MSKKSSNKMKIDDRFRGALAAKASSLGFDTVAITRAAISDEARQGLRQAISDEFHGSMDWLATRMDQRGNPQALWPDASAVIILGMNYGPECDPMETLQNRDVGTISVYARNRDYHDVIKGKLKLLSQWLIARYGGEVKVFVDTAPVMEKPLAAAAGIGWQGKHTNLVSKDFGSWLFLGAIFSSLDLPVDEPIPNHCGSCQNCLDACPTDAFPAPYKLDARRCISYLTIENKGPIPVEFRKAMGNRIYGCDDCLAVCPWNKFAKESNEIKLQARADLQAPALAELLKLDDASFRALFSGSPIKRIGRNRFIRNCLVAAGNSQEMDLVEIIQDHCLNDEDELIREHAEWALSQLGDRR